jgi:uncharacterized membrane protein YidH (DUF202 family)
MTDPLPQGAERGLQPERTALAWRRTGLALVTGTAAGLRTLPAAFGPWSTLAASALCVLAATAVATSHLRYRWHEHALSPTGLHGTLPTGALAGLVATTATFLAVLALVTTIAVAW